MFSKNLEVAARLHRVQKNTFHYRNNEQYICKINRKVLSLKTAMEIEFLVCDP